MRKEQKIYSIIACILSVVLFFGAYLYWDNNTIEVSEYVYQNDKIPESFDSVRILQISDLESKEFGEGNSYLLEKCIEVKPDYIFITGDLLGSSDTDTTVALNLIKGLSSNLPSEIYYVYGNHEMLLDDNALATFEAALTQFGVHILDGEYQKIYRGGDCVNILGFQDVSWYSREYGFHYYRDYADTDEYFEFVWERLARQTGDDFTMLLSHHCECFNIYKRFDVDLIFSGHAHGGIVRLPFNNALFAPEQGFFPEYFAGRYESNGRTMFVSRGLGMTNGVLRVFNRANLNLIVLKK